MCGGGPDRERRRYVGLARELGVGDRVVFTGPIPYAEVGVFMRAADVFALPAFHEPFGLVLLEALASGCPIVTTDQGGPPRFIPQPLLGKGHAIVIPGLQVIRPCPSERDTFVATLAKALSQRLAQPLDATARTVIADAVSSMSWAHYVVRLSQEYRQCADIAPSETIAP